MPRARIRLARIESESARKVSFNKRKDGLMKKVDELTTLCGVPACIVIYGRGSAEPTVYPNRPEAEEIIRRYLSLPGYVRCKKEQRQESYLKEKVLKMQEKHNKILKSNTEKEMNDLMHQGQNGKQICELNLNETYGLLNFAEEKMKEIQNQIAFFEQAGGSSYTSAQNEPANMFRVPLETGMEWSYGIFGQGDGNGSVVEMGFQMMPQCYYMSNIIGGSSSVNVVPNMIPHNGNFGNLGAGNGGDSAHLPQVDSVGTDIFGNTGMLPQYYYGDNVMISNGSNITGWAASNGANCAGGSDAAGVP